jgi:hypothetical protein
MHVGSQTFMLPEVEDFIYTTVCTVKCKVVNVSGADARYRDKSQFFSQRPLVVVALPDEHLNIAILRAIVMYPLSTRLED